MQLYLDIIGFAGLLLKGHGKKDIIEDLNLLGSHICSRREEMYYKERKRRETKQISRF